MPKWADPLRTDDYSAANRPPVMGTRGIVCSGHYVASLAGARILQQGGNAIDAGVAAGLCINVLQPDMTSLGGVAPIMIYRADTNTIVTIDGLGVWPRAASIDFFESRCGGDMPPGILRSVVPAAVAAWTTALEEYGTMSFAQVAAAALELAEHGFPVYRFLYRNLVHDLEGYRRFPTTSALLLRNGAPPPVGTLLVQADLAATLRRMIRAEEQALPGGRRAGVAAARAEFYEGETADCIARFVESEGGLLRARDLGDYRVRVEQPLRTTYRDLDVFSCGPWCQGPVLLQTLNLLESDDVAALEHNSSEYLHVLVECLKLAFADREAYYGDPAFVDVPMDALLAKAYARERRRLVRPEAHPEMPPPGDVRRRAGAKVVNRPSPTAALQEPDTSYVAAVDRWGNAFSATPSDSASSGPIVPGVGCIVSTRGSQSWLTRGHPSAVAPGKRPRLTPSPAMVFRGGRPALVFGTPGGDIQPQAMVQVLVNVVDFGIELQTAVETARVYTHSFPNSFWPHTYRPAALDVEPGVSEQVAVDLSNRGHRVKRLTNWERHRSSGVCAIRLGPEPGLLIGAADSRRESYAIGW